MNLIFKIKDKSGRLVHLSKERWIHIIQEHPELTNKIESIKETILNPTTIKTYSYEINIKHFYSWNKISKKYLIVIVKYLNGNGFVITSFYTRKLK